MEVICSCVTSVTTYQSTRRNPRRLVLSPKPQNLADLPLLSPAFLFHWSSSLFCVVPAIREECVTRQRRSEQRNSQQAWNLFKIRPSSWLDRPSWPRPSLRGSSITLRQSTLGRTPLDEWSYIYIHIYIYIERERETGGYFMRRVLVCATVRDINCTPSPQMTVQRLRMAVED